MLRQSARLHAHPLSPTSVRLTNGLRLDGSNPREPKKRPACPPVSSSTRVRTLWAPRCGSTPASPPPSAGRPPCPLCSGSTPRTSIQPVGSSSPNSPERTSPSMNPTTLPSTLGDDRGLGVPPQVITDPALPNFRPVLAADLLVDGDDGGDVQLVERTDADFRGGFGHSRGLGEEGAPCALRHKRGLYRFGTRGAKGGRHPRTEST